MTAPALPTDQDVTGWEVARADGTRGVVVDGHVHTRGTSVEVMFIGARWTVRVNRSGLAQVTR